MSLSISETFKRFREGEKGVISPSIYDELKLRGYIKVEGEGTGIVWFGLLSGGFYEIAEYGEIEHVVDTLVKKIRFQEDAPHYFSLTKNNRMRVIVVKTYFEMLMVEGCEI